MTIIAKKLKSQAHKIAILRPNRPKQRPPPMNPPIAPNLTPPPPPRDMSQRLQHIIELHVFKNLLALHLPLVFPMPRGK